MNKKRLKRFKIWINEKELLGVFVLGLPLIWIPFAILIAFDFIVISESIAMPLLIFTNPLFMMAILMALLGIPNYDRDKMLKENEEYYKKMQKSN